MRIVKLSNYFLFTRGKIEDEIQITKWRISPLNIWKLSRSYQKIKEKLENLYANYFIRTYNF